MKLAFETIKVLVTCVYCVTWLHKMNRYVCKLCIKWPVGADHAHSSITFSQKKTSDMIFIHLGFSEKIDILCYQTEILFQQI